MYMLMKVVPRNLFVLCEDGKVFLFLEGGIKMKRIGFIGAGSMAEAMIKYRRHDRYVRESAR